MGKMKLTGTAKAETLKTLENFTLLDDTFMSKVFEQDKECASYVLSILLGKQLTVKEVRTQDEIFDLQGHDIRLDIKAVDAENKFYDIEVQRDNRGATPRRARRNTSMIDSNFPNPGKYGENLPELYLIFITEHDYWKKNKGLYPVNKTVSISETETIEYDDGSHVLYANGAYEGNDKIGELMHDFRTSNPEEMHDSVLKDRSNYLKRNKQGVEFMCKAMDDLAEKRAMARVDERNAEIANNMFAKGMTVEDISELLNIPVEKVLELKDQLVVA